MRHRQKPYQSLQDLLGVYYHREDQYNQRQFWYEVAKTITPYPQSLDHFNNLLISQLQTSQTFFIHIFKFLEKLPYLESCKKILNIVTQAIDPSYNIIKAIINNLVQLLEEELVCLSELNLSLTTLNSIFQNQIPLNDKTYPCIFLAAPEQGINIKQQIRWPFQKGGTLAFWYNMSDQTKQCKIFQFLNDDKCGFEIIMKNKKIYIQKIEQVGKFRLIKNNSTYLCEAIYNKDVKLCIQFEIKKKFFQPFFSINVIMNNFVLNGVELDSFQINKYDFHMKMFKGFYGKFYSALVLTQKLATQVQQINGQKGFVYQSDIRNFNYLFDQHIHTVLALFSCARSFTRYSMKNFYNLIQEQQQQNQLDMLDDLQEARKQEQFIFCKRPQQTIIFDAIKNNIAIIDQSGFTHQNLSIKKQIENYGGFSGFLPFLTLLQINMGNNQLYAQTLNNYLNFIKTMFSNKTDSIQQANKINYFTILALFFNRTKMSGFNYETIQKLKQIYLALNSRPVRQKYFKQFVWKLNFPEYLTGHNFTNYIKFLKTFYNQDIEGSINIFGINHILEFIRSQVDCLSCCYEHISIDNNNKSKTKKKVQMKDFQKNPAEWKNIYEGMFDLIQNIFMMQRNEEKLKLLVEDFISGMSFTVSPCYIQNTLTFLQNMFKKDLITFKVFSQCMIASNCQQYFCFFKALSCCTSELVKARLISFILKVLGVTLVDQSKKQKEMLSLCIKYHPLSNGGHRNSSIKSQQNRDSLDYSQDKLSLNSVNVQKFITISPIKKFQKPFRKGSDNQIDSSSDLNIDFQLIDNIDIFKILADWSFSEIMIQSLPQDIQNPGLFILMELYKGSTYKIRSQLVELLVDRISSIRFGPQLMAWAIQTLMIGVFDLSNCDKSDQNLIEKTISNFLIIISQYHVQEQEQETQLSIIKLVYSSVKSKYPEQITRISANKTFFMICCKVLSNFVQKLREISLLLKQAQVSYQDGQTAQQLYKQQLKKYQTTCQRSLENCFTFIAQYFIIKGDDGQFQYEQFIQQIVEIVQKQAQLTIQICQKIFQILVMSAGPDDHKIIDENYAQKNHYICNILFRDNIDRQKDEPKFLQLILVALQNSFESFEDMNIDWRKKNLYLIKKYLVYMIELTQNSGTWKIEHYEEQIKSIFWNGLSFFQQKFSQYYFYPFQRHKNLNPTLQSKIRKNIEELKKTIFTIFVDLIQLIQYIDSKGSMEHKSFYELMKPKRKAIHKFTLKNIYPSYWKKADQQIFQFMSLSKDKLSKDAQQKLQSHIAQKRISMFASGIQKVCAKKLNKFIENERIGADDRQKKSISYYKIVEAEKCKIFVECEQQITLFRIKVEQQQKSRAQKNRQIIQKQERTIRYFMNIIWNNNRTYQGLWTNKQFYTYAQAKGFNFNNNLQRFYYKTRSNRYDSIFTLPFIQVIASPRVRNIFENNIMKKNYTNQMFMEESKNPRFFKPRGSDRIKVGLQFLKRKVIDKLIKKVSNKEIKDSSGQKQLKNEKKTNIVFNNVLLIKPMKVQPGFLKIQSQKKLISFCHCESKQFEHLSILKQNLENNQLLVKQWPIQSIQNYEIKRYLMKRTGIQIYFKDHTSVMFAFVNSQQKNFEQFLQILQEIKENTIKQELQKSKNQENQNWWQKIKKFQIDKDQYSQLKKYTQKWKKCQISNFQYLMRLNMSSGRTLADLNQYPIFPWVYSKYSQTKFKKNQQKYRNFKYNMGSLGSDQRSKKFVQNFKHIQQSEDSEFPIPHHFGFHYLNLPTVLYYLIRVNPYSDGAKQLQGGKFDVPDRIFSSIPDSYHNAKSQSSDVRELIPQFFYFPEFLINFDNHDFGQTQQGNKKDFPDRKVNHVELPNGCMNAFDFIENHRQALQKPQVSQCINLWIDLIFGVKNSGKQAQKSINTFHYLSNQQNTDLIDKMLTGNRQAIQSQMAFYGKTPSQVFSSPHPSRLETPRDPTPNKWKYNNVKLQQHYKNTQQSEQLQQNTHHYCHKNNSRIILFNINLQNTYEQQFIIVYQNGYGLIFVLDDQMTIKVKKEFSINYQIFERIQIYDQRLSILNPKFVTPIVCLNFEKIVIGGLFGGLLLYQIFSKNTQSVYHIVSSNEHQSILSCSQNGQIVKWKWNRQHETSYSNITYNNKLFIHSEINSIKIDDKLKIFITCTEGGLLFLTCLQKLQNIRVIKLSYPINSCILLRYPFYLLYIQCKNNHQYCYTVNGSLIDESQLEEQDQQGIVYQSKITKISFDNYRERILKVDPNTSDILVMAMPDFEIEDKFIHKSNNKIKKEKNSHPIHTHLVVNQKHKVFMLNDQVLHVWNH